MPVFNYRAKTKEGRIIEGIVEAETEGIAKELVSERGFDIIKIDLRKPKFNIANLFKKGIKKKDIVIFSRQISVMVTANIPIVEALKIIAAQTENPVLQEYVYNVYMGVESGTKLSEAMAEYPKAFDNFYVNMVKSGETSGRLDEVLNYLADQIEKDFDLLRKIQSALIYPLIVIIAMITAGMVIVVYVIPKLAEIFSSMGVDIPWPTRLLLWISGFVINYWWVVIAVAIIIIVFLRTYYSTYIGKVTFSKILFKIPVFGILFKNIYILRFSRSLSTLMIGGVNLIDSLQITSEVVGNVIFRDLIDKTVLEVQDGNSIVTIFIKSKFVPPILANMMLVGEQTGRLDYILEKLGDFYAKEIDNTTNNIMVLMEPIVMVLLGMGVTIMVLAVYLPMYTLPSF